MFAVMLLAAAGGLYAQSDTVVRPGRAVVDEVVADTAMLAPVKAAIPFAGFRYAHVDAEENVTFIADDPVFVGNEQAAKTHGIYRSYASDGRLECLVGPDTVMPGANSHAWIRGLQSDGSAFVFHARTRETKGARPVDGVYYWDEAGGLVRIAQTGLPCPGGGEFRNLGYAALDDQLVVFSALDSMNRPAVYASTRDGQVMWRVVDGAGVAELKPPADGFAFFWFQPWLRDGALVFGAVDEAGKEGAWFAPLVYEASTKPSGAGGRPAATRLSLEDLPVPDGVTLNYVETTSTSRGWMAFNAGQVKDPDRHGYGGEVSRENPAYEGVFVVKGDAMINIVDTETYIPGRKGETFTDFRFWTTCDQDRVVFVGRGPDGFAGVYLYDVNERALYPLASTDGLIDGMQPVEFEVGSRPLVGERCALAVKFKSSERVREGVYLATLQKSGKRPLERR